MIKQLAFLRIIREKPTFNFMKVKHITFAIAIIFVVGSLVLFATRGLNLGIDFLGGIMIEAKTDGPADVTKIRSQLGSLAIGDVSIQEFGQADTILIRVQRQSGGDNAQQSAVIKIKDSLASDVVEYRRTETVGPTIGTELQEASLIAVVAAMGMILIYIWFRFEWQYGVGAVLALIHDVTSIIGFYALFQFEFNVATVAAVLAVAGYSINDTVVIYDRVRENLRKFKRTPLIDLFNLSINETLSRTVITTTTTALALLALIVFGGPIIRDFSVALLWGVAIGTFSSIALAVPLLLFITPHRGLDEEEEEAANASEPTSKNSI